MKFAAIDIGSNGARLLITSVLDGNIKPIFKDVEYVRFPLRLGKDVFKHKAIQKEKKNQFFKLLEAYKLLMDLHDVKDYKAVATSAIRNAENGQELVKYVKENINIDIEVIAGEQEAEILSYIINEYIEKNKSYIHIDVGGGSTELNLYQNQEKIASKSFPVGALRQTTERNDKALLEYIQHWLEKKTDKHFSKKKVVSIGTGGNINKISGLIGNKDNEVSLKELKNMQEQLKKMSFEEKVSTFKLNTDRAETIHPASKIYLSCMQWANSEEMIVPKVGLKDGLIKMLYSKYKKIMSSKV